ncbi:hypothetical protein CEXT_190421 [Caerostris extrusa]|uniref:Peptidase aspartic putative domain-containing protein n=1 Tax=Caerostris extrusa TaxID=172846 RepID=A0AAV4V380_CAEEX|nr:hypothetical protein CEXT_190421 [Caerostris extrusa]
MCPDRDSNTFKNKSDIVFTKVMTNGCTVQTVMLMTLRVIIKSSNRRMPVRALVDTGSQLSYFNTRVIKELALKPKRRQRLVHGLFGGRNTVPRLHEIYEMLFMI